MIVGQTVVIKTDIEKNGVPYLNDEMVQYLGKTCTITSMRTIIGHDVCTLSVHKGFVWNLDWLIDIRVYKLKRLLNEI